MTQASPPRVKMATNQQYLQSRPTLLARPLKSRTFLLEAASLKPTPSPALQDSGLDHN